LDTPVEFVAAQPLPAELPPPIIVLGTRPTGTALIGAMIGRNPAAFAFPQLNLFVGDTLERMLEAMPGPNHVHGLLRALAYIYGSEQTIISIGMARRWIFRRLSWPTSQVFDELRKRVAPRRLVDKSASYSQNAKFLERIRNTSPDAYYVHVVEHPLTSGVAASSAERHGAVNGGSQLASAAISPQDQMQWLSGQRLIAEAMNLVAPDRRAVLQMERLLADPRAELSGLCERLGLPNDEVAVTEMLHPENSSFASLGPVGANLGDDLAFLHDPTFPPKSILSGPPPARHNGNNLLLEVAQFAARYGYE
jgi:Sulfotransferase family